MGVKVGNLHSKRNSGRRRRGIAGWIYAVVAIVIVAAAVGAYAVMSRSSATPAKPVDIVFSGWVSSGEEYQFDVQMVDVFNQMNPDIHVSFEPITGNYYSTLATRLSTGTGPAVFYMENTELPKFASAGYLLNLEPYLKSDPSYNLSDFIPSIIDTFYYKGGLYAAPKDYSVLAVFYNKELLSEAGLAPPPQNWNWSTYQHYLEVLKQKLPQGYYPTVIDPAWARILAFIHEAGGNWINSQGTGTPSNTTPILQALEFYYGLYKSGLAQLSSSLPAGWAGGDFATGKVAMVISGNWAIPVLESNSSNVSAGEWGVQWMPSDVQRGTMLFTVGLAVNAHLTPAQTAAAVKFVEFFTGPEGQFMWVMKGLALPTRLSILHNQTYINANPVAAYMAEQFPFAYGWAYNTTNWDAVHTEVHDVVENLFAGTVTVQQAYQEIVSDTNQVLSNATAGG
ncbi:ABC transporter substrate-binding protein [Sulfodiicoccus acidiphilus]|nr:ABC transporter substrate-binding protein [Sulfodiicoccus acidiphilus]